jgi:Sulfotransferase family
MTARIDLERDEDRLIWIFGSSRSGSTWLLRMLADLPGVVAVDDPHLGHHLGVWRPIPLAWAASSEPPALKTLLDVKREHPGYFFSERHRHAWWEPLRGLVRARFESEAADKMAQESPASTIVVKEPGSQVAGLLAALFPSSKVIFLLRDGRDVVDSWLAAYRQGSWAIKEGAFPVAPGGRLALVRWLSAVWVYRTEEVRRAIAGHDRDRRVLVRYEELRAGTAAALSRICSALGLDVDPRLVTEIADRHCFERVPPERRGAEHVARSATPGSWRENLSADEQLAMHSIMQPMLAELGYIEGEREPALAI